MLQRTAPLYLSSGQVVMAQAGESGGYLYPYFYEVGLRIIKNVTLHQDSKGDATHEEVIRIYLLF